MTSVLKIVFGVGLAIGAMFAVSAQAEDNAAPAASAPAAAPAATPEAAAGTAQTPLQMAQTAPKGTLKNPYESQEKANDATFAEEGHKTFLHYGCNGCHGGGGGGGMCPPITNGIWIYGDADDTLFRLVALGSVDLQKQGYKRQAIENIVAPMPSFGQLLLKPDDLWKIVTWIKVQAYKNTHQQ